MDAASPQVSVILPTRDRRESLSAALTGLRAQLLQREDFEILVVDDGSTDGTSALLAPGEAARQHRLLRSGGVGPAAARNIGARAARGRVLAFTDDDCSVPADWLQRILGHLGPGEGAAAAVGGPAENVLPSILADTYQRMCSYFYESRNREPDRARFITTNNFACRRDVFEQLGGFDERFQLGGSDREFAERLVLAGMRVRFDPSLSVRHAHAFTVSSYLRHLYRQGRGSHLLLRVLRREKGIQPPRTGLSDASGLIAAAASGSRPLGAAQRVLLVALGQAAALTGFVRAGAMPPPQPPNNRRSQ